MMERTAMKLAPGIGCGTMEHVDGNYASDAIYDVTLTYLKHGGRFLDCAEVYNSTSAVGRAIKDSSIPRDELHITTKLAGLPINRGDFYGEPDYEAVRTRLQRHLAELGLAHADLLLIHWPGPAASPDDHATDYFSRSHAINLLDDPERLTAACTWTYFSKHCDGAWANMRRLRDEGLCTSIGVSNFAAVHLERLSAGCDEPPSANEIFIDMTHQRRQLVQQMQARGILPIAYRALAFLPVLEMVASMGDGTFERLKELQAALGAGSVQQVVLAWLLRRGCHVLAKTTDEARALENVMATRLAESPAWPEDDQLGLEAADGCEIVETCMGGDVSAAVWMSMMPPQGEEK